MVAGSLELEPLAVRRFISVPASKKGKDTSDCRVFIVPCRRIERYTQGFRGYSLQITNCVR
jgi:hypothetical protein